METWLLFIALCSISTGYFIGSSIQTLPTNKVDQPKQYSVEEVNKYSFFSQSCIYLVFLNFQITKIYSGSSTCYIVESEFASSGQEFRTTNNTSVCLELSSYFSFRYYYCRDLCLCIMLNTELQIYVATNPRGAERLPPDIVEPYSDLYFSELLKSLRKV